MTVFSAVGHWHWIVISREGSGQSRDWLCYKVGHRDGLSHSGILIPSPFPLTWYGDFISPTRDSECARPKWCTCRPSDFEPLLFIKNISLGKNLLFYFPKLQIVNANCKINVLCADRSLQLGLLCRQLLWLDSILAFEVEPFPTTSEHLCYWTNLQANTEEELPEKLLGTVRISNLDMQKAALPPPEYWTAAQCLK